MDSSFKVGINSAMQKILIAQDLTNRTGILCEIQVQNLYLWPLIVFDANTVNCEFLFEEKKIFYNIKDDFLIPEVSKRCEYLEKSVKMLLGENYRIVVCQNFKQLFPEET